jgi:hypothetical protein
MSCFGLEERTCCPGLANFELQLTKAPWWRQDLSAYAGPRPIVLNSKDGRGPAVVLAGELNGGLRS